jgi:hypothetical protein
MSIGAYIPPAIHVEYELESESWVLMATSHSRTATAGERLFRGYPWPQIAFSHETKQAADKDAAILRAYLADCAGGKRREEATVAIGADYWED